jgi:phosphoribosylformylglycinamidine synthase
MKSKIQVTLKESILDPQGQAVHHALDKLGFNKIQSVRIGKYIEIESSLKDKVELERQTKEMCEKLLINEVIESYTFSVEA